MHTHRNPMHTHRVSTSRRLLIKLLCSRTELEMERLRSKVINQIDKRRPEYLTQDGVVTVGKTKAWLIGKVTSFEITSKHIRFDRQHQVFSVIVDCFILKKRKREDKIFA